MDAETAGKYFKLILLVITVNLVVGLTNIMIGISSIYNQDKRIKALSEQQSVNTTAIQANSEKILDSMLHIAQQWDKLSRDNPEIKVPKADSTPPAKRPLTDIEMTRPTIPTDPPGK